MWDESWRFGMPYALGLSVALIWGQLVINWTNSALREKLNLGREVKRGYRQSRILGLIECVMYLGAFLLEKPEFVAVWLGLKTVIRWRHWESDIPVGNKNDRPEYWVFGRDAYNLFLIGNGLVLLFAAAGWQLIELTKDCQWPKVIAVLIGLLVGSVALYFGVKHSGQYEKIPDGDPRLRTTR
ncbi:MAG: hypothetical protein AB7R40_24220 [Nitrospiraceae bacterium]